MIPDRARKPGDEAATCGARFGPTSFPTLPEGISLPTDVDLRGISFGRTDRHDLKG